MTRESQKVRLDTASEDAASNIELILDLVLSYLPRTSILSSKWRYRWTTIPILVFSANCLSPSFKGTTKERSQALSSIIDHVLTLHSGSIQVLMVKDLCNMRLYKVPPSVYACSSLTDLRLLECVVSPPSYFKGFKNLKRLYLANVCLTDDVFENLVSSCPLLEELTLVDFRRLCNVKIDAGNLQYLSIRGNFDSIVFGHAMNKLLYSYVSLNATKNYVYTKTSLSDLLANLPNIQELELGYGFIECLDAGSMVESKPFQCKDLHYLLLDIDFSRKNECLAALFVFRSSPNLRELEVKSWANVAKSPRVWADGSKCYWEFESLQWVTIAEFGGTSAELEFIEYVLGNSPVLESMTIIPCPKVAVTWKVVKSIYGFKRASVDAEINFDQHFVQKW